MKSSSPEGHPETGPLQGPDKRAFRRLLPRRLFVLTIQGDQPLPAYGVVNDISDSGASISTDHLLPPGHDVRLKICFNPDIYFDTEARVMWSRERPGPRQDALGAALHGIQFTGRLNRARSTGELALGVRDPDLDSLSTLDSKSEAILRYLRQQLPGYPFNASRDRGFVRELLADFPTLDVLEEIKIFRWYYDSDPLCRVDNPRTALRRWMATATEHRPLWHSGGAAGVPNITYPGNGVRNTAEWNEYFQSWLFALKISGGAYREQLNRYARR